MPTVATRRKMAYPGHKEAHNKFYTELNELSGAYEEAKDLAAVNPEGISDAEEISKKVIVLGKKMRKHFTEMKQMEHKKSLVFALPLEKAGQRGGKYTSRKKVKGKWVYTYPKKTTADKKEEAVPEDTPALGKEDFSELASASAYLQRVVSSFQTPSDDTKRLYAGHDLDSIVVGLHVASRIIKRKQEDETPAMLLRKMEKRYNQDDARLEKLKDDRRNLTFGSTAPSMGQTKGARRVELSSEIETLGSQNEGLLLGIMDLRDRLRKSELSYVLPIQKAEQKTLTGGHQSDSWDRRLKNIVLVPPPTPVERDIGKETKKNKKRLKQILGTPLDVQYGVMNVPR